MPQISNLDWRRRLWGQAALAWMCRDAQLRWGDLGRRRQSKRSLRVAWHRVDIKRLKIIRQGQTAQGGDITLVNTSMTTAMQMFNSKNRQTIKTAAKYLQHQRVTSKFLNDYYMNATKQVGRRQRTVAQLTLNEIGPSWDPANFHQWVSVTIVWRVFKRISKNSQRA